ncbi:MAG: acyltransferase [Muribaculaceae bacterium]|nr:acyltransferase [Muribaculaceae bacterium]
MRLPLILGVIFVHSDILLYLPQADSTLPVFCNFMKIWKMLISLCVPAFFFISGYLFFRSGLPSGHEFLQKLKRRWRSLIIPYIVWNLLGLIAVWIKTLPFLASDFPQYQGLFKSVGTVLAGFYEMPHAPYPYDFPLWFLRDLILIVLCTPILTLLFKVFRRFTPLIFLALPLFFPDLPGLLSQPLFYFVLGSTVSLYDFRLESLYTKPGVTTLLFAISLTVSLFYSDPLIGIVRTVLGILWLISMAAHISLLRINESGFLNQAIFFIFACHGLYATVITKFSLYIYSPVDNSLKAFGAYFSIFLINVVLTLMIYLVCRRLFPRLTSLLTGGRRGFTPE